MINDRPLAVTRSDDMALHPITPSMLNCGKKLNSINLMDTPVPSKIDFEDMWLQRLKLFKSFWKSWTKDYLETLSVSKKWNKPEHVDFKVGDVVLLKEDTLKKNSWSLARITQVHRNSSNAISWVQVRTPKQTSLTRSVRQVSLLERDMDQEACDPVSQDNLRKQDNCNCSY